MPYLELNKDNQKAEDIKPQVELPNLEGLTVEDAQKVLKDLKLELQIQNEPEEINKKEVIIQEQLPKQGIKVYEGTKIIVKIAP